jgi:hypothetical protein
MNRKREFICLLSERVASLRRFVCVSVLLCFRGYFDS